MKDDVMACRHYPCEGNETTISIPNVGAQSNHVSLLLCQRQMLAYMSAENAPYPTPDAMLLHFHPDTYPSLCRHNGASARSSFGRDGPIRGPNVDQWLHRFQIFVREQAEEFGYGDEVCKQGVEIEIPVSVTYI